MDENRLITTMLWIVMIIWAAGIGVFYFFKSDRLNEGHPSPPTKLWESKISEKTAKTSPSSQIPIPPALLKPSVDPSFKETITPPVPSSEKRTITADPSPGTPAVPSPQTKEGQASIKPVVKSTPEPPNITQTPKPIQEINETSKPNGTFYSAQKITEGVVVGRRGAIGDHLDFYKITATGNSMILKLEPSLEEEERRFIMNVYNAKQQHIGKISGKTDSPLTINGTPQDIYYIGIDLTHAPVETPPYKLHVNFN